MTNPIEVLMNIFMGVFQVMSMYQHLELRLCRISYCCPRKYSDPWLNCQTQWKHSFLCKRKKTNSVRLLKTYEKIAMFSMFFRVFFTFIVLSSKLTDVYPMEATQVEIPKANQRKRLLWRYASNYKTVMPGLFSAKPEPRTDGKK